jgi:serine protease Do
VVVVLADGRTRTVKEIRRDPRSDLALLVIDPEGLCAAEWGDSESLQMADWVLAVGQPFGLPGTVTAGIVSGPRRGFGTLGYDDLIQTSAAINPGSSGGPLVDLDGKIVGINVAIKTLSGGYEGVGFAVPSARAKRIASDLAEYARVRRAYLGLTTELTVPEGAKPSAVVSSLVAGGPAESAGVRVGDDIVSIGGRATPSPGAVRLAVEFAAVGAPIVVSIRRDGQTIDLEVTPTPTPEEPKPIRR